MVAAFQAYVRPLEVVSLFKYLWRVWTAPDYDWPEDFSNLRNTRRKWASMFSILGQ